MEDSIKGILVTLTMIGIFITAILNFIIIFPQEQGVVFSDASSQNDYLTISEIDTNLSTTLYLTENQTSNAYDQWDVTTGFMGTNQIKQSKSGITSLLTSTFTNLITLAKQLFGSSNSSPIIWTLITLSVMSSGYILYMFIKFVRTGR